MKDHSSATTWRAALASRLDQLERLPKTASHLLYSANSQSVRCPQDYFISLLSLDSVCKCAQYSCYIHVGSKSKQKWGGRGLVLIRIQHYGSTSGKHTWQWINSHLYFSSIWWISHAQSNLFKRGFFLLSPIRGKVEIAKRAEESEQIRNQNWRFLHSICWHPECPMRGKT